MSLVSWEAHNHLADNFEREDSQAFFEKQQHHWLKKIAFHYVYCIPRCVPSNVCIQSNQ
jgi:hypothetical protein